MTFPRNMGQIPIYYNHFSTGRPLTGTDPQRFVSKYTDTPNTPLFPFGYGLSYAEFSYSDVSLSSDSLTSEDSITASVQLKNTGACTGTEVVQLYIQELPRARIRPVRELKGFTRITLTPGETQTDLLPDFRGDAGLPPGDRQLRHRAGCLPRMDRRQQCHGKRNRIYFTLSFSLKKSAMIFQTSLWKKCKSA